MLRIYCDFNDAIDEKQCSLDCIRPKQDIERLSAQLRDGLKVILYQTGKMEAEGTIQFDAEHQRWVGKPDWTTLRHVHHRIT